MALSVVEQKEVPSLQGRLGDVNMQILSKSAAN